MTDCVETTPLAFEKILMEVHDQHQRKNQYFIHPTISASFYMIKNEKILSEPLANMPSK